MSLDITKLPVYVVRRLQDAGYSLNKIEKMAPEEALDMWLRWEGIIDWAAPIIDMLDKLRAAEVKH
jgi:hypothetical protein